MGIVNLDDRIFIQIVEVGALFHTFVQDKLGAAAYHEILLVNTEQSALFVGVIRIKEQSQIFCDVGFIKGNAILHNGLIHGIHIK